MKCKQPHTHLYVNYRIVFSPFFSFFDCIKWNDMLKLKAIKREEKRMFPFFKQQQKCKENSIQLMVEEKKNQFEHKNTDTIFFFVFKKLFDFGWTLFSLV